MDENEDVRWTAAWTLAELGDAAAISALKAASEMKEMGEVLELGKSLHETHAVRRERHSYATKVRNW